MIHDREDSQTADVATDQTAASSNMNCTYELFIYSVVDYGKWRHRFLCVTFRRGDSPSVAHESMNRPRAIQKPAIREGSKLRAHYKLELAFSRCTLTFCPMKFNTPGLPYDWLRKKKKRSYIYFDRKKLRPNILLLWIFEGNTTNLSLIVFAEMVACVKKKSSLWHSVSAHLCARPHRS